MRFYYAMKKNKAGKGDRALWKGGYFKSRSGKASL